MDIGTILAAGVFGSVALGLTVTGLVVLRRSLRLLFRGTRVRGEVIGWVRIGSVGGEHRPSHHPRIRFDYPAGRRAEFTSEIGGSPRRWPVGHVVTVSVIGDGPRDAEVARPLPLLAGPSVMVALGAAALSVMRAALMG